MQLSVILELPLPKPLLGNREYGESVRMCKRGGYGANDVVDQYLFTSPCCHVEQVQHRRQQYVAFSIA